MEWYYWVALGVAAIYLILGLAAMAWPLRALRIECGIVTVDAPRRGLCFYLEEYAGSWHEGRPLDALDCLVQDTLAWIFWPVVWWGARAEAKELRMREEG